MVYWFQVVGEAITQRQLTALMKRWQKKLRLQDWKVKVRLAGQVDFDERGKDYEYTAKTNYGFCEHMPEARTATIWMVKPSEGPLPADGDDERGNIENTLVHELLHLHFSPFASKHPEDDLAHEQAIEAITEALLSNG